LENRKKRKKWWPSWGKVATSSTEADLLTGYAPEPSGDDYGPQEQHFWNEFFVVFDDPVFDLWESRKLFTPLKPVQHLDLKQ
jgi:hypothetical protein